MPPDCLHQRPLLGGNAGTFRFAGGHHHHCAWKARRLHERNIVLFRLTTNREDAEDLAHDTYVRAVNALASFTGRSTVKTWVFSIATNLARDHFRVRQRWKDDIQDRCRTSTKAAPDRGRRMEGLVTRSPAARYEFREHIDYCFTCISKTLDLEEQVILILKGVYGFKVAEIMGIVDVSSGRVKHAWEHARHAMSDIFDRRCTLVSKAGACYQCSEMQGFINPKQDARAAELRLAMVKEAQRGAARDRLLQLRAELIRSIGPLTCPSGDLHPYLLTLMEEHA